MPGAIEEVLRWTTPSPSKRRTATVAAELGGHVIAPGDKVVVWEGSANRDELVFEHATTFDISRDPNLHLGFGHGLHFCLGASLARLEMRVHVRRAAPRFRASRRPARSSGPAATGTPASVTSRWCSPADRGDSGLWSGDARPADHERAHRRRHRGTGDRRRPRHLRRPHHRGREGRRPRPPDHRRRRPARHSRRRRHPHALRRPGVLGRRPLTVVLARRHHRRDGQLLRRLRAVRARAPRLAHRDDGERRGHPVVRVAQRHRLDVGDLPRIPRRARPHPARDGRRYSGAARRGARLRDGRARRGQRTRDTRRHRGHGRDRARRHPRRRARVLDLAHHPPLHRTRPHPHRRHLRR